MLSSSQLKEAFDGFDKDKSGKLSLDEVVKLAGQLGMKVSKRDLETLFRSIDTNKDDSLDFEEFLAWYRVGKNTTLAGALKYQLNAKKALQTMIPSMPNKAKG